MAWGLLSFREATKMVYPAQERGRGRGVWGDGEGERVPHTRVNTRMKKHPPFGAKKRSCLCYDEREANFSERQAGANGKK